ncbi:MAG: hypothetical protein NTU73_04785 [Ignavibacteriae bacterium]|nr:hypothetical protein [Ignavibacteriota bacterium]
MKKEEYESFLRLDFSIYYNTDRFGTFGFRNELINLNNNIKVLIDEGINIILENEDSIPKKLIDVFDSDINMIKGFLDSIVKLVERWDIETEMNRRNAITNDCSNLKERINNYIQIVYYNKTINGEQRYSNLLTIIPLIKTFDKRRNDILKDYEGKKNIIDFKIKELSELSASFESELKDSKSILINLRTDAAKKVVYDYSNIFLEQANIHSNYNPKEKWFKKYGIAEKWLFLGSTMIIVLVIFIIFMYELFPTSVNDKIDIPNLVTKISLLSIIIFVITFSFKQYSINKHLHTLNKHRENVLNSYQLFLSAISSDDATVKNALMLEVAKSIYEQGKTGFISERDSDSGSPSVIEFTKYLQKERIS